MVKLKDFSRLLSVFQVLFKAILIFKDFSRQSCLFKYFQACANPVQDPNEKNAKILYSLNIIVFMQQSLFFHYFPECRQILVHFSRRFRDNSPVYNNRHLCVPKDTTITGSDDTTPHCDHTTHGFSHVANN